MRKPLQTKPVMKKKGLMQGQAVGLVAALALGLLLLQFTKPFISAVQAQDIIEGCKLSVGLSSWQLQKDLWVMDYTFADSPFKLNCKTIFTEITDGSINRYDDRIKLSKDDDEAEEQLKELIMKSMRECWYMYGAGNVKLQQAIEVKDQGTTCMVCSEIIPTEKFKSEKSKNEVLELTDMYTYASTARIPPKDEKTYLEYFLEGSLHTPKDFDNYISELDKKKTIRLDEQYSIIFTMSGQTRQEGALFGWGGFGHVIKAHTGIVDCYLGGYGENPVGNGEEEDAKDIGCNTKKGEPFRGLDRGENPGFVFGKVIDGGTDVELLNW
ncbi:MAG: hypothetical protein AABX60_01040, partial [Nanoarchaeota archaeon]